MTAHGSCGPAIVETVGAACPFWKARALSTRARVAVRPLSIQV
jgi:hypothetical protein